MLRLEQLNERTKQIEDAIANGAGSIKEISRATELSINQIYYNAKSTNLDEERIEKICLYTIDLPSNGETTLASIGQEFGISKQRVEQILKREGISLKELKQDAEEERLEHLTETRKPISNLAYILKEHMLKKAEEEQGWGYGKAIEYSLSRKMDRSNDIPLENLIELFQAYGRANQSNQKLSLKELGDISKICFGTIGKILKGSGLEPMYGSLEVEKTPESKRQSIEKAFYLDLPASDIADIVSVPNYVVSQTWVKMRKTQDELQKKKYWIKSFRFGSSHKSLTYRLANKIYEEQDLGFNGEEIEKLLDTSKEVITHAISHRKSIEAKRNEVMEAII